MHKNPKPKMAILGFGAVTATLFQYFYEKEIPLKILCQSSTRKSFLDNNPLLFQSPEGKKTKLDLSPYTTLCETNGEMYDLVWIGCKNQNLDFYIRIAKNFLKESGKLILLQNGIPEFHLEPSLDKKYILTGVVGWNTRTLGENFFWQPNKGSLVLNTISSELEPLLTKSLLPNIRIKYTENPIGARFHKLAINSVINGLAGAYQCSLGELLLTSRKRRREAIILLQEIIHLRNALGIQEYVIPGSLPLAWICIQNPGFVWFSHLLLIFLGFKYRNIRTSLVTDLDQGKKTEISYLNGEVLKLAKQNGISAPKNEWVCQMVLEKELT